MSARLKKVLDFIESSGEQLAGCCSEEEGLALAEKLAPDMAYCTVRNWTIADLDLAEPEKHLFVEQGILPSLLYAERVLTDSACRFSPGDWVRRWSGNQLPMPRRSVSKIRRPCVNNRPNTTNGWRLSNNSAPLTNNMLGS